MRGLRVVAGIVLGLATLVMVWFFNLVPPPEGFSRRIAAFAAIYPGPVGRAQVERIACEPLSGVRLYVVCTQDCEEAWRIVAVEGLSAEIVADPGRIPAEPPGLARRRFNNVVRRQELRLDRDAAREMIGCYLRLEGLMPDLVLPEGGAEQVGEARRRGEDAMADLAVSLVDPQALSRIHVEEASRGFEARFLYWNTFREGRPVLEIVYGLARDGVLEKVDAWQVPVTNDTVSGSTPGTPPI